MIPANVKAALDAACERFGINTPLRKAHFYAQLHHESAGFTRLSEGLSYSADRLQKVWPNRFNAANSAKYARNPEDLANYVYANRLGNGDEASGDGFRFRGRGYVQLTGRDNYRRCSQALYGDDRLLLEPELLEVPDGAAMAAGWYWDSRKINALADRDNIEAVTRAINGGTIGLAERRKLLAQYKKELT